MKKILEIFGQVRADDIRGFRAPYLQPGGDLMFEALARCGMEYDTSMPAGRSWRRLKILNGPKNDSS